MILCAFLDPNRYSRLNLKNHFTLTSSICKSWMPSSGPQKMFRGSKYPDIWGFLYKKSKNFRGKSLAPEIFFGPHLKILPIASSSYSCIKDLEKAVELHSRHVPWLKVLSFPFSFIFWESLNLFVYLLKKGTKDDRSHMTGSSFKTLHTVFRSSQLSLES